MATTDPSPFMTLPDDVLLRVLLGVALDDHDATAAACRAFRAVIRGPRFPELRRRYGLAETKIILVGHEIGGHEMNLQQVLSHYSEIHVAGQHGAVEFLPENLSWKFAVKSAPG